MNGNMTGTVLNDAVGQATEAVNQMELLLSGTTYGAGEQSVYVPYVKVTPDNAKEYAPMYGYTLPEQTEMWMVSKNGGFENGQRIGMVSRPWGYTDSHEAEVISGGLCAKSIDAVAIGRHGNFFHWGFAAKPSDLTEPAKAALANAIVYMKDFKGKRIIARKLNEGIATRDAATASKYTMSRDCWKEIEAVNMKYYLMMDSTMRAIKAKQAAGEELSPAEMMHLQFPAIPPYLHQNNFSLLFPAWIVKTVHLVPAYGRQITQAVDGKY